MMFDVLFLLASVAIAGFAALVVGNGLIGPDLDAR
jgi:hypothetical protein